MSTVQYIILGAFILFAIAGVIVFAGFGGGGAGSGDIQAVSMWGSVPTNTIKKISDALNAGGTEVIKIEYTEVAPETFEKELLEAIADGVGPDLVILPHTLLLKEQNKLSLIPWSLVSERSFLDTFAEAGEVFATNEGVYAMPFAIDPLVMYWNRDIFAANGLAKPPVLWEEAAAVSEKVSEVAENKTIKKSGLSFGEYQNVNNVKEIIATLAMQAGSRMIGRKGADVSNNLLVTESGAETSSFESAVTFYTDFTDPNSPKYSWNRSLPSSQNLFLSGKLAMYFGFASELSALRAKNPNLNFDVALIPQAKGSTSKITYAETYGIAVVKSSPNSAQAFNSLLLLVSSASEKILSDNLALPPVRRDLLSTFPGTGAGDVFWQSALWSKSPLDPNPFQTSIFQKNMIESITSGQLNVREAVRGYSQQIDEIIR